jgi:CRP-like cAMP-binding protein
MPEDGTTPVNLHSEKALEAWNNSLLGSMMAPAMAAELLDHSRELHAEAGEVLRTDLSGGDPLLLVVVDGLLRIYTASSEGRQVTVRYVGAGEVAGLPTVLGPGVMKKALHLTIQAVTDAELLRLPAERFHSLLARHPEMAPPMFEELTRSLLHSYELLVENVFMPVRFRVARHLLDLATRVDGELVVNASQQSIANSIASVREVVSRVIAQMKAEGLIDRIPKGYVILEPAELHRITKAR